jgi:hypothetical protein
MCCDRPDDALFALPAPDSPCSGVVVLVIMPYLGCLLAEIQQRCQRSDEALATIERALALANQTGERAFLPAMHRVKARLQRARDPTAAT